MGKIEIAIKTMNLKTECLGISILVKINHKLEADCRSEHLVSFLIDMDQNAGSR